MTIEKGKPWGSATSLDGTELICRSDREASLAFEAFARSEDGSIGSEGWVVPPPVVLRGGDLYRTLGHAPAPEPLMFPTDLIVVEAEQYQWIALAHVVCRNLRWAGQTLVAMNGTYLEAFNLAPRGHPNDGRLDMTEGALPLRQRLAARKRAKLGAHLPHPLLTTSRVTQLVAETDRTRSLYVDGERVCRTNKLSLWVIPDAALVVL